MSSIRRPKLIQNDTFLSGGVETPGIPASEVLTLTGSAITKNVGDADFAATYTVVDANGVFRTGMKLRSTDRKVIRVNPDGTLRVMGGGTCTMELDSGAGSGTIAVTITGAAYTGEDPDTGVYLYNSTGGGGFPTGVSSAFAKAFYAARDATGFAPATWYDSNTWRIGVNQTTFAVTPEFGGTKTRCSLWKSIDASQAMNVEPAGYQGTTVSRTDSLVIYNVRGKPNQGATCVITATLVTASSNLIHWTSSLGDDWGTTTNLIAPAGAPFTASAASIFKGAGYVDGVFHSFNFVVDTSFEVDANGHPFEANRCYLPLAAGAIPTGDRFVAAIAIKAANAFNTWASRAGIMEPAMGGVHPAEYVTLQSASYGSPDGNNRNGADVGTNGGSVHTPGTSLAASEQRGAALYLMHMHIGTGVGADLSFVSGHYDRASHDTTRHEPISSVNPGITAAQQKVYVGLVDGWVTTASADPVNGPYCWEITYGDGNPTAHQYKLWNDDLRANPTRYGSNVAAEWTGSAVAAIHHSVWNSINNTRLQGQLAGGRLWWNFAQPGAMTSQIPQAFCRDKIRHMDTSKMGKCLVYIGEGVNDPPPTTSLAAGAAFMAQLPLAVIQYRSPDVTAAQMPVIFSSIMRPNIAAGQSGIGYDTFDGTFVQSLDAAMKAGGAQDLVAAGSANGYLNQQDNPVCDAAHNNGTYWQNPHLFDAGEAILETFIATDANAR